MMNSREMKYRHEFKYLIDERRLAICEERLKGICSIDKNAGAEKEYNIRSVYFDDIYSKNYYENENGEDPRYKYRIRIYNYKQDFISLERKSKRHGMTLKESQRLSVEAAECLLNNRPVKFGSSEELLSRFLCERKMNWLRPVIIVDYNRIPYVYKAGNVRITLDRNLSGSREIEGFWRKDIIKRPILEGGFHILEVKYDEYLPSVLKEQLHLDSLRRISFSKFYLCRRYVK